MPRQVGEWTLEKLRVLETYLPLYLKATTKALERYYIDAFAGPGTNLRGRKNVYGSPLIALEAQSTNGVRFDRLFLIERDESVADELEKTIRDRGHARRATVIRGDVNVELPKVVRLLHRRAPQLIFLDPVGIDPRWSTIQEIAPWRVELLINFPLGMSIKRNINSRKVTDYFGTAAWRPIWDRGGTGTARALLDLYKDRLRELGFVYSPRIDMLIRTANNQSLYYLLLASKVKPAQEIMNWVFRQTLSSGQMQLDLD